MLEYAKLAERLPLLRPSVTTCKLQTAACCGAGPRRKVVRCLQTFGALAVHCAACYDAVYCAPAGQ